MLFVASAPNLSQKLKDHACFTLNFDSSPSKTYLRLCSEHFLFTSDVPALDELKLHKLKRE